MNNLKIILFPTTKLGTEATGFSVAFLIFLRIGIQNINPKATFIIYSLGIIGFVMGIAALIKYKERSIFGFLPIFVGIAIIFYAISQILYPH